MTAIHTLKYWAKACVRFIFDLTILCLMWGGVLAVACFIFYMVWNDIGGRWDSNIFIFIWQLLVFIAILTTAELAGIAAYGCTFIFIFTLLFGFLYKNKCENDNFIRKEVRNILDDQNT